MRRGNRHWACRWRTVRHAGDQEMGDFASFALVSPELTFPCHNKKGPPVGSPLKILSARTSAQLARQTFLDQGDGAFHAIKRDETAKPWALGRTQQHLIDRGEPCA